MSEVKDYILELLRNGIWVFPVKGKGEKLDEAKRPLTFKEGDEKITWKNPKILAYSEELARRGHHAWAVWLMASKRFGLDLDLYKVREELNMNLVKRLKQYPEVYSEQSARGGVHIILEVEDNSKYKAISPFDWVEYKHDGYFIISPTLLKTREREYRYTRISGNILVTLTVNEWNEYWGSEVLPELGIRIVKDVTGAVIPAGGIEVNVEGLELDVNDLSNEQITAFLYLLFDKAGCVGMAKLMEWIGEYNVVPIKKQMYNIIKIPRSTRWLFQYEIAAVMAYLGFSPERTVEWLTSWKFIDEDQDPREDSLENAVVNVYRFGKLLLLPRGACPFCHLAGVNNTCNETPIHKIFRLSPETIKLILSFVKRYVN